MHAPHPPALGRQHASSPRGGVQGVRSSARSGITARSAAPRRAELEGAHRLTLPLTLVVFSGLPGSGKSAIARPLARELGLLLLELDLIEAPLLRRFPGDALGWSGYEILTAVADDNLALGHSVVLDCVTWTTAVREQWRTLAGRHHARFRPIEVVCGDRELHRTRVEGRAGGVAPKNAWPRVEESFRRYEAWASERFVLDSTGELDALVGAAIKYVSAS